MMKEKMKAHNECVMASECPINKKFESDTKCVDGMAGEYPCNNIDLLSFVPIAELGSTYDASDSWGWTDPETSQFTDISPIPFCSVSLHFHFPRAEAFAYLSFSPRAIYTTVSAHYVRECRVCSLTHMCACVNGAGIQRMRLPSSA